MELSTQCDRHVWLNFGSASAAARQSCFQQVPNGRVRMSQTRSTRTKTSDILRQWIGCKPLRVLLDVESEQLCPCSSGLVCSNFHRHNDDEGGQLVMIVLPAAYRIQLFTGTPASSYSQVAHKGAIHTGVTVVAAPSGRSDIQGKQRAHDEQDGSNG